jgi:hypothetical protein
LMTCTIQQRTQYTAYCTCTDNSNTDHLGHLTLYRLVKSSENTKPRTL